MEMQPGDSIIVESMIALADTSRHLMEILKVCEKDNVSIHFLNEELTSDELLTIYLQDLLSD